MQELNESFRILRVRVEDQAPVPSVVVVSSALRGDGASYVASGLARAFAEFRHRTLLIDANGADSGPVDDLLSMATPRLTVKPMFGINTNDNIASSLESLRAEYDVVVVVAPPVPGSSLALSLARAADGIILAVRLGRRKTGSDDEMMRLLGDRRILGVVPTQRPERPVAPARSPIAQPLVDMFERLVAPALRAVKALR